MLLKARLGLEDSLRIMLVIVFECVSNSIMDPRRQVVDVLVGLEGDSLGELFFIAIGILEGELIRVVDHVAMVELGFDAAHGWGEAVVAVVAIGVASLHVAAMPQAPIGGTVLLWCQVIALPVPGAIRVDPSLVGGG